MASLIPGYEYDIFISYRQKDNKGDRWVSEFVEALKTELESTFKEEISVYFDINPHDGLLETHDVDASLKEKLKCLVFIPVLSRTYCDQKSFAWRNEFEAFVEQASKDRFGLKIRLPDGNTANRILPVCIHDLQSDDIKLCESVLGDSLKGIDFIYESPGINRPLRSKEDKPHENLNKTIYRDQINKTALAVKQIILGLKGEPDIAVKKIQERQVTKQENIKKGELKWGRRSVKLTNPKLIIGAGILAVLILAVLFIYPGFFRRDKPISSNGTISVAVMPFQNLTNDTALNIWQDGIQYNLITSLTNINAEELKVRQLGTISRILKSKGLTDYTLITPSVANSISRKLETNVYLTGSIKLSGSTIRVNAQFIDTKKGKAFKSFQIDGPADNILPVVDSLSEMVKNFLIISEVKKGNPDYDNSSPVPTNSPEAFRYIISAEKAFSDGDYSTAIEMGLQALKIDSGLYGIYFFISASYSNQGLYEQAKKWCLRYYSNLDKMDVKGKADANIFYARNFKTPDEEIMYIKEMINMDDQDPGIYHTLGDTYSELFQYDKAIQSYEKAFEIYHKWGTKPGWVGLYSDLGVAYHKTKNYKKEKILYRQAEKDVDDNPLIIDQYAWLSLTEGDTVAANRYIEKWISIRKEQLWSEADIATGLASIYSAGGIPGKAEEYLRQALFLEPENPAKMNRLAKFLIDNDRNIDEGLELADRALKSSPDNFNSLHWKGWGLYKQGNYKEALELLEKSWNLRTRFSRYDHTAFLHLEAAKKTVAGQNQNEGVKR